MNSHNVQLPMKEPSLLEQVELLPRQNTTKNRITSMLTNKD